MKHKNHNYPKGIKIESISDGEDNEYRLYKTWSAKKVAKEPFLITTSIEDMVEVYSESCKKWNIKPNLKEIYKIVNINNQQNKLQDETVIFKSRYS